MKITANVKLLEQSLRRVMPCVTGRSPIPVLNHVLISGDESGRLTIDANDMTGAMTILVPDAEIATTGSVTADAKMLHSLVSKLPPDEDVEVSSDTGHSFHIRAGKRKYKLPGVDPKDYPKMPMLTGDIEKVEMDSAHFASMLRRTAYAASKDNARSNMESVYLHTRQGKFCAVATDTHRLARVRSSIECGEIKCMLPLRFVPIITSALEKSQLPCSLEFGQNSMAVACGDLHAIFRQTEGQFPNYERVTPSEFGTTVRFDREEMLRALSRLAIVAADVAGCIVYHIDSDGMRLSATSPTSDASEEIEAAIEGNPLILAVNYAYAQDALSSYEADSLTFKLTNELRPALIVDESDDTVMALMMPMQVR